jgi:hypothetical protein
VQCSKSATEIALCDGSTRNIPDAMLMRVCDAAIQEVALKNAWLQQMVGSFPISSDCILKWGSLSVCLLLTTILSNHSGRLIYNSLLLVSCHSLVSLLSTRWARDTFLIITSHQTLDSSLCFDTSTHLDYIQTQTCATQLLSLAFF